MSVRARIAFCCLVLAMMGANTPVCVEKLGCTTAGALILRHGIEIPSTTGSSESILWRVAEPYWNWKLFESAGEMVLETDTLGTVVGSRGSTVTRLRNNHATSVMDLAVDGRITAQDGIALAGGLQLDSVTPAQITATQNDYSPPFCERAIYKLSSDAARSITGLDVVDCAPMGSGTRHTLWNIGSFDITLEDSDAGSLAQNRFSLRADFLLKPGYALTLLYDDATNGWRPEDVDMNSGGGGGLSDGDYGDVTVSGGATAINLDASALAAGSIVDTTGLKLDGDAASPGSSKFYGTDASGIKGWYGYGYTVEVQVDFGSGKEIASTVVTGQAWIAADTELACSPTMTATTDRAEGAEDAVIEGFTVAAHTRVAGTGFTLTAAPQFGAAVGKYNFHCAGA